MKAFLILLFMMGLLSCGSTTSNGHTDSVAVIVKDTTTENYDSLALNVLSQEERAEGWRLLFNGKDLSGWHIYQHKPGGAWFVENGYLHCKGEKDFKEKREDLTTDSTFENFELALDWKIAPQGNSGIIYLASEEYNAAYLSGPEYQLIDDRNFPEKLEDWQKTGANYAMGAPLVDATKPAGLWNHSRIVVYHGHVEHWLNGQKTASYEIGSPAWKEAKEKGKWKDAEGYGATKKGHIDLQDHGSEIWFKNIRIKEL
jgi:hypothetical protein